MVFTLAGLLTPIYSHVLMTGLDQGLPVNVIYLDFANAFDRVPIRYLIVKLQKLGTF